MRIKIEALTAEMRAKYPYGIKAYGSWDLFATKKEYVDFLREWIANTDGAEQDRAYNAYYEVQNGHPYCDSDNDCAI